MLESSANSTNASAISGPYSVIAYSRPMPRTIPPSEQSTLPTELVIARQPTVKATLMARPTADPTHFCTGPCWQFSAVT